MATLSDSYLRLLLDTTTSTLFGPIFLLTLLAWSVWRVYRFTIQPLLHPDEPKEIPYLIPFIGMAALLMPYANTQHGQHIYNPQVISSVSSMMRTSSLPALDSKEPFALSVAGTKTYVLTRSEDVSIAYRNTTTLSFDIFVQHLMRSCGTSEKSIQAMFKSMDVKEGFPNPHGLALGRLSRALHIHQLFPGPNFDDLSLKFVAAFEKRLDWDSLSGDAAKLQDGTATLPLLDWVSDVLTLAGQNAYFGPHLGEIDGKMHKTFQTFDALGWQVLYQYPRILSRTMCNARDQLVASLETYFSTPQEKRTGDAWFVKAEENEMRARGIDTHDIATMMLPIYWGINTNTRKLTFWLLAYILSQHGLVDAIRDECQSAFDAEGNIDPQKVESCARLNGAFYEAIRITAFSASVRYVAEDTTIGNKVLRAGSRLMIPYRQLHFDNSVFGTDVHVFDPERFIKDETLLKSSAWRPFGGGITMCPGRHIAKRAVCVFVAMLLQKYDIEKGPGQSIPEAETKKPVLGIMDVADGCQEMFVRVTRRKHA